MSRNYKKHYPPRLPTREAVEKALGMMGKPVEWSPGKQQDLFTDLQPDWLNIMVEKQGDGNDNRNQELE